MKKTMDILISPPKKSILFIKGKISVSESIR